MKTLLIHRPPSALSLYGAALRSSSKKAKGDAALPALKLVQQGVTLLPEHIRRYAEVCEFSAQQGVPPVYPHMLVFPLQMQFMCQKDFPWSLMGLVHLENTIEQYKTLRANQQLDIEVTGGQLIGHEKGQAFALTSRVLRGQELVWESQSIYLRMGLRTPQGSAYKSELTDTRPLSHQGLWDVPANIGRRYGWVSGDVNPIHMTAITARLLGFKQAIAHGMWTKARALAALLPPHEVEHMRAQVEFKTPLFLPARATLWSARTESGTGFEVRNEQGDKPHLRGKLTL